MASNPLKWLEFEQLGREFYNELNAALSLLAAGADGLGYSARQGLAKLEMWLESPCVATVKLDGTNLGVDNTGLIVGRRQCLAPDADRYQKVDVSPLRNQLPAKAECMRLELSQTAAPEDVAQAMLYGELVVTGKYNYKESGIFQQWLCFGVMLRPTAEDPEGAMRLADALRSAGYNARALEGKVCLVPNVQLATLMQKLCIRTVTDAYRPTGPITEAQWTENNVGNLLCFKTMRQLILGDWARRFLLPSDCTPLGEGLVVASEVDGKMFKWKQAGEELGKVLEQLAEAVGVLRGLAGTARADLLPPGLVDVFERLLLVASAKPANSGKATAPRTDAAELEREPKRRKGNNIDSLAVWESTLTKFDDLESTFDRGVIGGTEAFQILIAQFIEQVARDLVKDYGVTEADAQQKATSTVKAEIGKRYGMWKKSKGKA